jgi:hypothetical protein
MDLSVLSPTTVYSRSDTVFKFQRIEAEIAFARTDPEGAHIFPKAKCKGNYAWLDKESFNRLALSKDGHTQFDGTAHGCGVKAETCPKIALEPHESEDTLIDRVRYMRIKIRLWCRDRQVAEPWRPFLDQKVTLHDADGHCYYIWVYAYCKAKETVTLLFEKEEDSDGTERDVIETWSPSKQAKAKGRSYKGVIDDGDVGLK